MPTVAPISIIVFAASEKFRIAKAAAAVFLFLTAFPFFPISRWRHPFAVLFALACAFLARPAAADDAPTGTFTVALLQVTFSDQTDSVHVYSVATLQQAGTELNAFYNKLSYGKLNLVVKVARVTMTNTTAYYYGHCENDTNPPVLDHCTQFTQDAVTAEQQVDAHFFDGVDGVATLVSPQGNGQFTWTPITVGTASQTVQRSYLQESAALSPPLNLGPSDVQWAGWSHEIGHELQYAAALAVGGKWNGHPAGYLSGYDLMDSCYPCGLAPYGLLGPPYVNDNRGAFPAWLDSAHVATVPIPTSGTVGQTFVLPPLTPGISTPVVQAVKVPIDGQNYYMVNARARQGADTLPHPNYPTTTGIYDEGIQIELVDEAGDPPVTFCSGGGTGCVYHVTNSPYPYLLWHPGQTLSDPANKIEIRTLATVTGGYTVEVDRNVPAATPNLFITPWLTPPMNTYETVDIWIDSSCNGYEDQGGVLRYGRRPDGTVIGNGDDPCVNHENRIYATVHNIGQSASQPTTVTFQATSPLGVGVTGNWQTVNTANLPAVAPGASATVYVAWTPQATLTAADINNSHFAFHSCVRAIVNPDPGDVVTTNKSAQENIDYFESVQPKINGKQPPKIIRSISLFNAYNDRPGLDFDPHRLYTLRATSHLPAGWTYELNGGKLETTLGPNATAQIPVVIVPKTSPVGQIYSLRAEAATYHWLTNPSLPETDPMYKHFSVGSVGGVELDAHTVYATSLTLSATRKGRDVTVTGKLQPVRPGVLLAIDATEPQGKVITELTKTDANGAYSYTLKTPDVPPGSWHFRAIWQGDMTYASAVSPSVALVVR